MDTLLSDLRFAMRTMRRSVAVYLLAVVSLGIGVAANTTIFSAVDVFLIRPLPFPDGERLVQVWSTNPDRGWTSTSVSIPDYTDWKQRARTVQLAAYQGSSFNVVQAGEPERVEGMTVAADFFRVLGEPPLEGRLFTTEDEAAGAEPVALIRESLWQRRYGGTAVLGRTIDLNGRAHTIVGVVAGTFTFPTPRPEVWVPLRPTGAEPRATRGLSVVGRLNDGQTVAGADTELNGIAAALAETYPADNGGMGATAVALRDELFDEVFRTASAIVSVAVLFVLLIACANVANLLLARASAREREIAVRTVLGAGRWRVARQLLTESLVLALLGGALGVLLSVWGIRGLLSIMPESFPFVHRIGLNPRVLGYTLLVCLASGVLFGLAPTLHALRPQLSSVLREAGGRGSTLGRRGGRFRGAMVMAEIGLALVLLVCAGLLMRGYGKLRSAELGFAVADVATLRLTLPESQYEDSTALIRFYDRAYDAVRSGTGLDAVSGVSSLPLAGGAGTYYTIAGEPPVAEDRRPVVQFRAVLPGYFETLEIPLRRGRAVEEQDRITSAPVAVVNEAFVRRHWPGGDSPIGQRIELATGPREIVGVVADTREWGADEEAPAMLYVPVLQRPARSLSIVSRSSDVAAATRAVRAAIASVDPRLPLYGVSTMAENVADAQEANAIMARLLGIFAGIAVLMAVLGVYGVMSYSVAQRTQEVGVRMALGAGGQDIVRLIVRQGSVLALAGIAGGLLGALVVSRFLAAFLFGVSPFDAATFAGVSVILGGAAILACWIPALRATRVDPAIALRAD
ncbi:MAG TPA: ABC transporter permease [Longimicrobiales bacterium]|nr:ABC transporter permease [Longimicrobiales bacterium]